jgi:hypothetical protein
MAIPPVPSSKIKYINNRELLKEIHESKKSFCYSLEPKYADFDVIVHNINEITPELIDAVREKKSKPRGKPSLPMEEPENIVVRLMTYTHIPLDPDRVRKSRVTDQSYARTSFPPFKHYILTSDGLKEVCRSHWTGGFENGYFVADGGKINNRLAMMFMLLVERYSRRTNWRGYCHSLDTEALTQRGWISGNEINMDDIILSYKEGNLIWSKIKSIYKDENYNGKMFNITGKAKIDAFITPGHKFLTENGLKPIEYLTDADKIILTGNPVENLTEIYEDAFVELVGWVVTEGCFEFQKIRKYPRITIYQNEGIYADRIRNCAKKLGTTFSEYHRRGNSVAFHLKKEICNKIAKVVKVESGFNKVLKPEFIVSLTTAQRELLIQTMIDADGWRGSTGGRRIGYDQKCKNHIDSFIFLCTLAGYRTKTKVVNMSNYDKTNFDCQMYRLNILKREPVIKVKDINFNGGKKSGTFDDPNIPTEIFKGTVWCPETEFGSFICRRNGIVYLSGNSYVDEFRGQALLQLSQIGLQFDESKSDNPFAFYTTAIKNSFTRVFNLEKKSQNIRDDLLIIAGVQPSYTRTLDNEFDQRDYGEKKRVSIKKPSPKKIEKPIIEEETPKRGIGMHSNADLFRGK